MGLLDRFFALFARRDSKATQNTADEMALSARRAGGGTSAIENLRVEQGRRAAILRSNTMYDEDPRVEGIIGTLARDAVMGGFVVRVAGNPRAEAAANDLAQRLKLRSVLDNIVRLTLIDGDSFLQLGVDADGLIRELQRMPTLSMVRMAAGERFADARKAFWQAPEGWYGGEPGGDGGTWFAQWQIIHARWNYNSGRYGRPLFASAQGAWRRTTEGEKDMAVRRKTRSGLKYLHVLEGATPEEIEAYQELNQDALDDPFAAVADFFSNRAGSLQAIQGDAQLGQIEDVMHHIRTFWTASPVPMSLLGYGQDLNRDVLEVQADQYDRALMQVSGWLEDEIVRPLLERQWLLLGIWPEGLKVEISWQAKKPLTAATLGAVADAGLKLRALGVEDEQIGTILGQFLPGLNLRGMMGGGGAEAEAGRLAAEADELLAKINADKAN